jgi:hypothetical protein
MTHHRLDRRRLLQAGGITLGLPMLDLFRPRRGEAAPARKIYSLFMVQANGVAQAWGSEPEMFWPRAEGALSRAVMESSDADRATSELKEYADKLLMVRGVNFAFSGSGCGHSGGCNQVLTAARVSDFPRGNRSLAMGESIDNRIARVLTPNREPLALYVGRKGGYIDDAISYRGKLQLRTAENNPWNAYMRLTGLGSGAVDPALAPKILNRRKSINDMLRGQLRALTGRSDLSTADRQRLDLHLSSVRDLELSMIKQLPLADAQRVKAIDGQHREFANFETVTKLQMDLIAFAFASDLAITSTLQLGDGNDGTEFTIDGVKLPNYHMISHRIYSHGDAGESIPNAIELHHKIDRLHARTFKHLLDKLSAYTLPEGGTLLDACAAVWCNSLANGPPHGYKGVPYIVAGGAGGALKKGTVVNLKGVTNNRLFNTLLTAVGVRKADGALVDDFGDPSLTKGQLPELLAT